MPSQAQAVELDRALAAAFRLHQQGRIAEAERLYRQILTVDPGHVDALHLAGLAAHQRGHSAAAARMIAAAIARRPGVATFHINLGHVLAALGRGPGVIAQTSAQASAQAIAQYETALALSPGNGEALKGLGAAYLAAGRSDAAIEAYRRALADLPGDPRAVAGLGDALLQDGDAAAAAAQYERALAMKPDDPQILGNLGTALMRQGDVGGAVARYRRAAALSPEDAAARNNLATALVELGELAGARAEYEAALRLKPDHLDALSNLGSLIVRQGRHEEGIAHLRRALALGPDHVPAHAALGYALVQQGQYEAASEHYGEALRRKPSAEILNNLGNLYMQQARYDDAVASFERAIALKPDDAPIRVNLAITLMYQGRLAPSAAEFERALALEPDLALAHWNEAVLRLLAGDYAAGWAKYEWRWAAAGVAPPHDEIPPWRGEDLAGRTLLLHHEQGLGDTLQFCRLVPGVAERAAAAGGRVVLEVPRGLVALMRSLAADVTIVAHGEALPPVDLQCPLMSLPYALGITLETLPAAVPYLAAEPARRAIWAERLRSLPGLKVGLAWAGEPRPLWRVGNADARRSIALARLAPLGAVPGVTLVSLQKGAGAAQAATPPAGLVLHDFTAELEDFADTAALVAALDLVISVDTSIVHLAGALGRPVWLLNRFDTCWRWLTEREDSPWYPTLRQFRQATPGDWEGVIAAVAAALAQAALAPTPHAEARLEDRAEERSRTTRAEGRLGSLTRRLFGRR